MRNIVAALCWWTWTLTLGCTGAIEGRGEDPALEDRAGGGADAGAPVGEPDATVRPRGDDGGLPAPDAAPIGPEDPGLADVRLEVDTTRDRHAISPFIYGTNQPRWDRDRGRITLARLGGNRWTAYNWENNASNAGSDWHHQNDAYLGGGDTPGGAIRERVEPAHEAGAAAIVTVPIAGYVAADKRGDGDVAASPDYLRTRFHASRADRGASPSLSPDTRDGAVYQEELVHWVERTFDGPIFYSLDNEPDLWDDTHTRIRSSRLTYAEITARSIEHARSIRRQAPDAPILGPVSYGWEGMVSLQGAPDASGIFLDHYLRGLREASEADGRRLLDVLDVHWYPEARGGGVRVTDDDASPAVVAARVQAPRSLWDPAYVEDSWIARDSVGGPVRLIPWLRERIDGSYPGTRIGITEYYYGGGAHISGGVAQADVLGIFGREDVFAATLWHLGGTDDRFIHGAFALYRDYDGAGGRFGDVSVHATTDDVPRSAVYASVDAAGTDRVVVIAINRTDAALDAALLVTHTAQLRTATLHQLTAASPAPAPAGTLLATARNAFRLSLPPLSATALVLTP